MAIFGRGSSTFRSVAVSIPEQIVTTDSIMDRFVDKYDMHSSYLRKVTGIRQKRRSADGVLPSDLASQAAQKALDLAGMRAKDVDVILYTGLLKDLYEPSTAAIVQDKLGATKALSFDITNACHGFMNGVYTADAYISGHNSIRNVLVVTGEQGSRYEDYAVTELLSERKTRKEVKSLTAGLTLGDAGGAILMTGKDDHETGLMEFSTSTHPEHYALCTSGSPMNNGALRTQMTELMRVATDVIGDVFYSTLNSLNWDKDSLKTIIPHQTGASLFSKVYPEKLGLSFEMFTQSVEQYGNLITASLPVNLEIYSRTATEGERSMLNIQGSGLNVSCGGFIWPRRIN